MAIQKTFINIHGDWQEVSDTNSSPLLAGQWIGTTATSGGINVLWSGSEDINYATSSIIYDIYISPVSSTVFNNKVSTIIGYNSGTNNINFNYFSGLSAEIDYYYSIISKDLDGVSSAYDIHGPSQILPSTALEPEIYFAPITVGNWIGCTSTSANIEATWYSANDPGFLSSEIIYDFYITSGASSTILNEIPVSSITGNNLYSPNRITYNYNIGLVSGIEYSYSVVARDLNGTSALYIPNSTQLSSGSDLIILPLPPGVDGPQIPWLPPVTSSSGEPSGTS